jgi:tRNA pseudouridine38-40 synthase
MTRYFLELSYKGSRYAGFQIQQNANTVQAEVEKAVNTILGIPFLKKQPGDGNGSINLTGSSRTDAGVHALQNFFHFDLPGKIDGFGIKDNGQFRYKVNAVLPPDIVLKDIYEMPAAAHCRFDALSREYLYKINRVKNPFLRETSYFFPYKLDIDLLNEAAAFVREQTNFFAFCKTNTQVKNFQCSIYRSEWKFRNDQLVYNIEGNRFLRGMVRLLTASILKVGRGSLPMEQFRGLFGGAAKSGYSVPAHGLFLKRVNYPEDYFSPGQSEGSDAVATSAG